MCFYRQVVRQDTLREPSIELQRVELQHWLQLNLTH